MQIDRRVPAGIAQQRDHPLRLAQRIASHQMAALGLVGHRFQQPGDFRFGARMLEHRQPESGFGDQQVARHRLIGLRRTVGEALVVARHHHALPVLLHQHLRRAQNMAGRKQRDGHLADMQRHAEIQRLELPRAIGAIARLHDGDGVRRRQHRAMPGPGVVGMAMGDDGPLPRHRRVDIGVDGPDMQVPVEDHVTNSAATPTTPASRATHTSASKPSRAVIASA